MAYQGISTGTSPNDGTGDDLLTGAVKINSNFEEIYNSLGDSALFTQSGAVAVPRTVESKLQDVVSVKDFGADPTGATDSTAAIQAAIDSGKAAFVPKGTYKISATLNLNNGYKALIGDDSLPVINKTTAGPAIRIGTTSGAVLNEYSIVKNLYLQSTTVAPTFATDPGPNDAGVVLDGGASSLAAAVQNARVINVRVGNWSCGFYTNDVVGCRIEGCFAQLLIDYSASSGFTIANKFCGYVLDGTPYTVGGISPQASIELVDNDVTGIWSPSNVTSIGFYVVGSDIRDIFFDRCETSSTSYGWFIAGTTTDFNWDIHIRRAIVDSFKLNGILVSGATGAGAITIDGGYFLGKGATAGACIYGLNSNGITVTGGAQILGIANDSLTDDGVRLDTCNSCSVVGNNFVNLNYGISLNGSKNCTVTGNHFYAEATDTEPNPTLYDAIRLFDAAEENTIIGNVIKGKDGTDKYSNGIIIAASCPRNVIVGNCIDESTVVTPYAINDATTTLLSSDALQVSARTVLLQSNNAELILQGNNAATPVVFRDGAANPLCRIGGDGAYLTPARLALQGNDVSYPVVFRDGAGNVIAKIDNSGNYSTGAP